MSCCILIRCSGSSRAKFLEVRRRGVERGCQENVLLMAITLDNGTRIERPTAQAGYQLGRTIITTIVVVTFHYYDYCHYSCY